MDLPTAAKRYEETRRFWAREIAGLLMRGSAKSQVAALRILAASGEPLRGEALLPSPATSYRNNHSRATSTNQLCRHLLQAGLVTRRRYSRGSNVRTFLYALSELGSLVLDYIPDAYGVDSDKKTVAIITADAGRDAVAIINMTGTPGRPRIGKSPRSKGGLPAVAVGGLV